MDWQRVLPAWARRAAVRAGALPPAPVPAALWQATVATYPFLERLTPAEDAHLQQLVAHFLQRKEFSGAHGLVITDAMAVAIAAQACVLLLYFGEPADALRWYDDFVGIVVHADDVVARRKVVDEAGVVHHYREELMGEAMEGGPVMLSWAAVQPGHAAHGGHTNVVIHEFAHKLDMHDGEANGCPPLPAGFLGARTAREGHAAWCSAWEPAYADFREQVVKAERFGAAWPWLDSYGATAPAEFFAVVCEAYFVSPADLARDFPGLMPVLDAFFLHRT